MGKFITYVLNFRSNIVPAVEFEFFNLQHFSIEGKLTWKLDNVTKWPTPLATMKKNCPNLTATSNVNLQIITYLGLKEGWL